MGGSDAQPHIEIAGPAKYVEAASAAARALVAQHAVETATQEVEAEYVALVQIHLARLSAAHPRVNFNFELVRGAEGKVVEGKVVLRGTAGPLAAAEKEVQGLLEEAEECAADLPLNAAQLEKLTRPQGRDRDRGLLAKLQAAHEVAFTVDKAGMLLSLRGRADAVTAAQQALEGALDVDEHERQVPTQIIPVIIGKGGSTIKRLQQDSGATFDLDRSSGRVRVLGRKAQVVHACELLDELLEQVGGSQELPLLPRQIPLIIGRGGATIKQLQADSGASISVSKEEQLVRMRGSKQAVDSAMLMVKNLLAAGQNNNAPKPPPGLSASGAPAPPPGLRGA